MLVAQRVTKSYASRVLDDVSLEIASGEVHALLGANGAGKSTLAKILAGVVAADAAEITFRGESVDLRDRQNARELGIEILLQELSLFETLDVAENLFVDRLPTRWGGRVNRAALDALATKALEEIGLELSPRTSVASLGVGERQLVEIAGALSRDCELLILDEPTAALSADAVGILFERIRRLCQRGVSVMLITHRLEEVEEIADRVTVLADGRVTAQGLAPGDGLKALEAALGIAEGDSATSEAAVRSVTGDESSPVALAVDQLCWRDRVRDVSMEIVEGEIFGIAGLVGSGRSDLLKCVFGAHQLDSGDVRAFGQRVPSGNTRASVELGLGLVPEERQSEGLFLDLSILSNLSLATLRRLSNFGVVDRAAERDQAARISQAAEIHMESLDQAVRQLSGGNQQKVVFGRWMQAESRILLLDEPSRGVDLGARGALHNLLRDLIAPPRAAVVVSSDFDELLLLCDRIAVMASGTLIETRDAASWSRETLLSAALERAA